MAQNYQAINGSPYAGSLAVGNNPASIVNVPYAWDITPFAVQLKQTTNAFVINNYSFLSSPQNAEIMVQNGISKKFVFANQDIRLMNTRINLNAKSAIAFGANIRDYVYTTTSEYNSQDTVQTLTSIMKINVDHLPFSMQSIGSTWAELYGTYARTIIDDGRRLLNAGLTLKVNRALAYGYVNAQELSYTPTVTAGVPGYLLNSGSLQYSYSSNFDNIDSNASSATNRKNFLNTTRSSLSADIGLEFVVVANDNVEEGDDYAYSTKIAMSIMDIGKNKYVQGRNSKYATAWLPGTTNQVLENKFTGIKNFDDFNDSLATVAGTFNQLSGEFYIYQPTRLMINVDQYLVNNFFLNAELTIPLLGFVPKKLVYMKDMNLLAVTPRWEQKSLGAYMPILVNNRGQAWLGAAFRAGPILLGTHNLGTLFSKNKTQTGGFYLALTIRPGKNYDGQQNTSGNKLSGKERRSLECPKF